MNSKKFLFTTLSLFSILGYGFFVFAAPPGTGGYSPGETLNPDCAPGDIDCVVTLPSSGSVTADNGLTATGVNVQLGGTLLQNTILDQDGKEFSITNNGTSLVSGADPLNLFSITGQNYPGIALATDGTLTGGLQQWIGAVHNGATPVSIFGNFDFPNSIQAGLVIEDLDVELSSSDGVSGSSNISLRYGDLSLGASNQLTIYPNVIQFSSFFSGRDDSGTSFPTNFLYTDGTGKLQSAPTSLLGGGGSSLSSQDEGTLLTSTTTGYNFIGAGVTATESGGLVTVNIPGGVGGANIYNTNGTLTNNRTLNGNGRSLSFTNLSQFLSVTQNGNTYSGLIDNVTGVGYGRYVLSTKQLISGVEHTTSISSDISGFGGDWDSLNAGIIDVNLTTDNGAAFEVQGDSGISFIFRNSGIMDGYVFPRTDGTANQILTTDGLGQLSWQNAGGGSALQLYSENPSLPYTSPVASGLNSVAIGNGARASADDMIVWGKNAGFGSLSSTQSTFLGTNAGYGVVGITSINNTFIGANAGYQTSNVNDSIFIGSNTGYESDNAYFSNFIGQSAGYGADNSDNSNFIGQYAGHSAIGSSNSIFFGFQAGASSLNSSFTTAIGYTSGTFSSSEYSNFFGFNAGASSSADYSNFIGFNAGETTTNASNSIFIGTNSGSNDTVNNTTNPDDFSILLGNNTSTGGFSNSIAIGGFATNTSSNQFMIGSTTRPIDETKIIGSLGTECTITTGTGMACTSDERLKTNIVDLNSDTLTKLQNVRTVSYNWLQNPDSPTQIGFLAQNLEQYFPEMVMTDPTGKKQVYYSQMTPILTKAIQEMNLKITDIGNMETPNTWRDSLIAWFGNVENGITDLYVKTFHADRGEFANEICLGQQGNQTCVTKDQLDQLLLNSGTVIVPNNNEIVIDDNSNPVIDPAIDESFDNNQETPVVDSVGESESENTEVTE